MRRHDLTTPDIAVFVGAVVSNRVMHRADVIPHQQRIFLPVIGVKIFILHLQRKKVFKDLVTLLLTEFVNFHGIARVGVQHFLACDRMGQESRVNCRRAFTFLFFAERWASTAWPLAHHVPELVEIVCDGFVGEALF